MKILFSVIIAAVALGSLSSFANKVETQSFCGDIRSLSFKEYNGKIYAFGVFKNLVSHPEKEELETQKITVSDPKSVFKMARVISQLSIQNPMQLAEDLKNSNFQWDPYVGHELHPNPYEEDFSACLAIDLKSKDSSGNFGSVTEIIDIFEDGYSFKDLLDSY